MNLQSPRQIRSERLISATRLVMAIPALLAIWLDPFQPPRNTHVLHTLLIGYTFYASVLVIPTSRTAVSFRCLRLATHVLDLVFFPLLVYLTVDPGGHFFIYFVFSLACAIAALGVARDVVDRTGGSDNAQQPAILSAPGEVMAIRDRALAHPLSKVIEKYAPW